MHAHFVRGLVLGQLLGGAAAQFAVAANRAPDGEHGHMRRSGCALLRVHGQRAGPRLQMLLQNGHRGASESEGRVDAAVVVGR